MDCPKQVQKSDSIVVRKWGEGGGLGSGAAQSEGHSISLVVGKKKRLVQKYLIGQFSFKW